ncbi:MAG: bifunctional precorrin-2 dehydrogenase/sirohydrochlorin ferrochelatase [Deltaproteobacteria bacterium]|nr:MAG: bifunctional precorrin-2 dehydrogenase/sirohydrochlorin ferrochelatase [Deltaproteobacteria bacterium]
MTLYPVMLNLENRHVLVVGGGTVATRKVKGLMETGARIRVVSPEFSPEIQSLVKDGKIEGARRDFSSRDLEGVTLAFAATDDPSLNDTISEMAMSNGIPVNNITRPETCTFFVPSRIRRGDLILAISTSGRSPAMARWLRETLENQIGPEFGDLTRWMGILREFLLSNGYTNPEIKGVSEYVLHHDILQPLRSNDHEAMARILTEAFRKTLNTSPPEPLLAALGLQ